MIIEFTLKNFRSFKDEATLSMEAEGLSSNKSKILETANGLSLLPSSAIFGANASGKTNVIKAMSFMLVAMKNTDITNPSTGNRLLLPFKLDEISSKKPTFMQIILWDPQKEHEYCYGFEINKDRVISEWLYLRSKVSRNFTKKNIFTRKKQSFDAGSESQQELVGLFPRVNDQFLALPVFAQLNHQTSRDLIDLVQTISVWDSESLGMPGLTHAIQVCNNDQTVFEDVNKFIAAADTGIKAINIREEDLPLDQSPSAVQQSLRAQGSDPKSIVKFVRAQTEHRSYKSGSDSTQHFNFWDHESSGTLKLFVLMTFIIKGLKQGNVLLIDELDSSLHPLLVQAILSHIEDRRINQTGLQLIYTSHDSHILARRVNLRRDQIWFADKNQAEESTLIRLSEFKTRNDYDISSNYLLGRFGAVPILGAGLGEDGAIN